MALKTEKYRKYYLKCSNTFLAGCTAVSLLIGRDVMTICKVWKRWIQEIHTKHHTGPQHSAIADNQEDRHLNHMALMDRTAMSRALIQEMESFAREMSARTVR